MSDRSSFSPVPSYRRHKQSGQAVVTLTNGSGGRRDVLLGKYGTKESRVENAGVIAEWEAAGRHLLTPAAVADLTITELILAYYRHVEQTYPDKTLNNIKDAMRPLKELYGTTPACRFGPRALKALQGRMVADNLCRNTINRRVGRMTMIRWTESEELVPPSTLHALLTAQGLAKGRSPARDTEGVKPVHPAWVEATLPYLAPTVADMVRLQQATGMRSGELVILRTCDLDTTGKVWLYRPGSDRGKEGQHKTAHLGHQRVIAIGPTGQGIVRQYLKPDMQAYLFSPGEAWKGE